MVKCSLPPLGCFWSGGSQFGTTHLGGEADNLEMAGQTICECVVFTILTLQSDLEMVSKLALSEP
jgi:hypothetical protein